MTEPNPNKPACAIAEWIYPFRNNCMNALIAIGRRSSDSLNT